MNTLRVKPAEPGAVIPRPEGGNLPAEGDEVPNTEFWRRLRAAGDVVDAEDVKRPAAASAEAAGGGKPGTAKGATA